MTDENRGDNETGGHSSGGGGGAQSGAAEKQSGDPGRTPGTAEGDEETVDESLRQKES
ncbi:MAG TPA: hypothetical protein VEY11_05325 [Pyrinomonadaceae bacterium]|nr:hypothetical protein [Pyrinomonadaceae bacterium]